MTQPDTLHTRLRAEIDRQLAVARAAVGGASKLTSWINWPGGEGRRQIGLCFDEQIDPTAIVYLQRPPANALLAVLELGDPIAAIRRYEGELEVLERHVAETFGDSHLPEQLDLDPDEPWCRTCRGGIWPCADLIGLAHRLGVSVDG